MIVALGVLLAMFGAVVTATPALARGPKWEIAPADPFTVPANWCGFEIGVTFPVNKTYTKIFKVGDAPMIFLSTGLLQTSYTNLQTGKTITKNLSSAGETTVQPDGSLTFRLNGVSGAFFAPADAARFGLPTVSVFAGVLAGTVTSDGSLASLSLQGHVLVDVCAALS